MFGFYDTLYQRRRSEASGLPSCDAEVTRGVWMVLDGDCLREIKREELSVYFSEDFLAHREGEGN